MQDGIDYLMAFIAGPQAIEEQEAAGQRALVEGAHSMPIDGDWAALEALGVVREDDADDLFARVRLPDGWRVKATDHAMWSDLLDESGRKVASIFYKAAFYDRRAFFRMEESK